MLRSHVQWKDLGIPLTGQWTVTEAQLHASLPLVLLFSYTRTKGINQQERMGRRKSRHIWHHKTKGQRDSFHHFYTVYTIVPMKEKLGMSAQRNSNWAMEDQPYRWGYDKWDVHWKSTGCKYCQERKRWHHLGGLGKTHWGYTKRPNLGGINCLISPILVYETTQKN